MGQHACLGYVKVRRLRGANACLRLLIAAPARALCRGSRSHGPAEQVPPQRRAVLLRDRMQCCMSEQGDHP